MKKYEPMSHSYKTEIVEIARKRINFWLECMDNLYTENGIFLSNNGLSALQDDLIHIDRFLRDLAFEIKLEDNEEE